MKVLGLDPSTVATGAAMPGGALLVIRPRTTEVARRLDFIAGSVRRLVARARPDLVVIEGYDLRPKGPLALVRLGEVGGVIRRELFTLGVPYVEVSPGGVKRFATGNGNAKKPKVVAAVELTGAKPEDDNAADAFVLRAIGRLAYGDDDFAEAAPENRDVRLEVVASLTFPGLAA